MLQLYHLSPLVLIGSAYFTIENIFCGFTIQVFWWIEFVDFIVFQTLQIAIVSFQIIASNFYFENDFFK